MAQLETWLRQDLKQPIKVQYLGGNLFSQDNQANLIVVEVFDDGVAATLGGSVSASVIRADGGTVAVPSGTVSGNKASVVLPQAAYAVPGQVSIVVKLTQSGTVTTLAALIAVVYRSSTDTVIDPGTILPSVETLIAQVNTAVASIPADYSNLWATIAPAFSNSTAYTAGQYVTYNGHLYRFTADHGAGTFVSTDCTQVDVGGELSSLKSAIKAYTGNENIEYTLQNGYYPTSTVGATVDFNTPTLSQNFEAAIVPCVSGDTFTVNGIGGATGRLWAFLDSDKKVVRRETNNYEITDKVITAETGEAWLVINNNKTTLPNAKSYYGIILLSRVEALENTQSIQNTEISALQVLTTETANNLIVFTGNEEIKYTLQDGYYTTSTVGDTVDFNSPSSSYNFEAAIVECTPGDVFTINGIGGSNGRLWAFLDASKKVVRRETINTQINGKVITAQTGEVYLVINNNKTTVPDAVSYKGEVLTDKVSRIEETAMVAKTASGTETAFSDLLEMGVYGLSKAQMSAMIDKPSDVDDAVGTLINYSGAYLTGAYTIQRLYQLSGKAWERLVYTPTGEVIKAWERIDFGVNVDNSNILKGKKLVTAGDSYTQAYWDGDYAEYNGKNYGYYIAQRNNMTFVNSGISGSTMAVPPGGAGNKNPFVIDRYTAVPADTDYLTIWFGINDAANCDLGSITDGDDGTPVNNTIYGAWNIVLKYYLTNRPWMKVLIIVPSMPSSESANNVRNAIRAVSKKWGYPYLDWQMDYSIPAFFDKREGMSNEAVSLRRAAFGYDGPNVGHPNPQWYEYESTIIEAKLRSI